MMPRARTAGRWVAGAAALAFASAAPAQASDPASPPATSAPALEAPAAAASNPPATGGGAGPAACESDCDKALKAVPVIQPFPRPGFFPMPPAGPGYYSFLDVLPGNRMDGPPMYPYPRFALMQPSFFDTDWKYLDDPKNAEHDDADCLKRIRFGDCLMFTTGGSVWNRYMDESNGRLTAADNDYLLTRVRSYGDLWHWDTRREVVSAILYYPGTGARWDLPPH